MKVIVFDTETTGLPVNMRVTPTYSTLNNWPYIVQFSYIFYDTTSGSILSKKDHIIKLKNGIKISEESSAIHRITNEIMLEKGVSIDSVLCDFMELFLSCDLVVAHNMEFDKNMLLVECYRMLQNERNLFYISILSSFKKFYCTMQETVDLCNIKALTKIEKREFVKFPSLAELYRHLFGEEPLNLHNSLNDVVACLRCFHQLRFNEDICLKSNDVREMLSLIG